MNKLLFFLLVGAAGLWAQNQNLGNVTVNNINVSSTMSLGTDPGINPPMWTLPLLRVGATDATHNPANASINFLSVLKMNPSASTVNFAKYSILGYCESDDNTATSPNFRDCIGIAGYATINAPVTNGRAFGLNVVTGVASPADGSINGGELDIENSSSEVSDATNPSTSKNGLIINSAGSKRVTAGIIIGSSTTTNGWFYGVLVKGITAGGIPYSYAQAGTTACTAAGIGSTGTCTMDVGSQDLWGNMILTPSGTGIAAAGSATVNFSQQLGVHNPVCIFEMADGTGAWQTGVTHKVVGRSVTGYAVGWANAAVALTSGSSYYVSYHCDAK